MTEIQARNYFDELLDIMQREPVFIMKDGKPVGAFVSMEHLQDTHIGETYGLKQSNQSRDD